MEPGLFIQGIILGLTLAVPVGPIALLCIRRTVAEGRLHGITSGLGVAAGDSFYAAVAFLGITAISSFIISQQLFFRLLASVVLVAVGIRIWQSQPLEIQERDEEETYLKDFLSVLAITLSNPMTIIFFITVLPGLSIVPGSNPAGSATAFVAGIFLGSMIWWIILGIALGSVRHHLNPRRLLLINRISGSLITCAGIVLLLLLAIPCIGIFG
jgi:threonine/homoserine/homoserine lactone efflux protein